MKSVQQESKPDCLLFSLFNIEQLSCNKGVKRKQFTSTDGGKRDVFLMSLLGMKLMSDRIEIKEADLKIIEKDLKRDIEREPSKESAEENERVLRRNIVGKGKVNSDNSNDPLRTV